MRTYIFISFIILLLILVFIAVKDTKVYDDLITFFPYPGNIKKTLYNLNSSDFENLGNWQVNPNIYRKEIKWDSTIKTARDFYNKYKDKPVYNRNEVGFLFYDKIYKDQWCRIHNIPSSPILYSP